MLAYVLTLLTMLQPRTTHEERLEIAGRIAAYAEGLGAADAARVLVVLRVHEDGVRLRTTRPYGLPRVRRDRYSDEDLAYASWLISLASCHSEDGAFSRYESGDCRSQRRVTRSYVLATARSLRRTRAMPAP